ncbi:calpain family cysteine protease containing protein [Stylonychia lemnae]|uniref:Calpain family cysteine protease containing protein n=1 Tax=Stylonychia lemnae TaxID=5949 RepID=A0A078ABZ3_STYLE|nr:calpain family cysteine protease containing protein [Stylonychia lemnae]|eukprot:CDW79117.1 calpain family cysteine protease containing protein [Stylonychia lemnae]
MSVSKSFLLVILGVSVATASHSNMQKLIKALPQAKQVTKTCTSAIERSKAALPDYKKIVTSNANFWNDTNFPADGSSIQWTGTKFTSNGLGSFVANKWERLNNLCPECTLYGSANYLNDIKQGALGDCYYLAGISAIAEINSRFVKIFVNPEINWAGLYAFNVYIKGIPQVVVVDDSIPAGDYGKSPVFAGLGTDKSIWGSLLEKAWAKTNANYEQIVGGLSKEAYSFLQNIPSQQLELKQIKKDALWTKVSQADAKNWIMSISTPDSPNGDKDIGIFNLAFSHEYSLLSVKTLYNKDRSQQINLFQIRNPWRTDKDFSGSFKDGSSLWLTLGANGKTYAQQADLVIADDGIIHMTLDEVMQAFELLIIGEYQDNFVTSWYDKRNDLVANENTPAVYKFTLPQSTPMQIRAMTYPARMYPNSCKSKQAILLLRLEDASGKEVQSVYYYEESLLSINLVDKPLAAGTYTLKFYPKWTSDDVRDYGIIINAPKDIAITDALGKTSRLTGHDTSNKELKPTVKQAPKPPKPQLPDISQKGAAYELTGNLDSDIVKIRNSKSLSISNDQNGAFLFGDKSNLIGGIRYGYAVFLGTLSETKTYTGKVTVTTEPGHKFKFSTGNDKCSVQKNSDQVDDDITCTCSIKPDTYPKECVLVLLTQEGAGFGTSLSFGLSG